MQLKHCENFLSFVSSLSFLHLTHRTHTTAMNLCIILSPNYAWSIIHLKNALKTDEAPWCFNWDGLGMDLWANWISENISPILLRENSTFPGNWNLKKVNGFKMYPGTF